MFTANAVPEPGALVILAAGICGLFRRRQRRLPVSLVALQFEGRVWLPCGSGASLVTTAPGTV